MLKYLGIATAENFQQWLKRPLREDDVLYIQSDFTVDGVEFKNGDTILYKDGKFFQFTNSKILEEKKDIPLNWVNDVIEFESKHEEKSFEDSSYVKEIGKYQKKIKYNKE